MLKNNPDFKEVFTHDHYRFYIPAEHTKYHTSRYVTANNQLIFANAGATADVITAHLDKIIEFCNQTKPMETMRTDIAAICNALLYRTKFPVDEKCGIRMGALLCIKEFAEPLQLRELCQRIKATFPNSIFKVTGDRTGKNGNVGFEDRHANFYTMIQKYLGITNRQMDIDGKNIEHNDSRQLVNTVLFNHPNVKICSVNCPKLIDECQIATVDETKSKAGVLKKDRDLYKMDLFDGFRYFFQTYFEDYAAKQMPIKK